MSREKEIKLLLDEYSIDELRVLGRNLGIKCPTGLSKDELAKEIVFTMRGKEAEKKETRGRPAKYTFKMDDDLDSLIENETVDGEPEIQVDKIFTYEVMNTAPYGTARFSSDVAEYKIIRDEEDIDFYVKPVQSEYDIDNYVNIIADTGLIGCEGCVEVDDDGVYFFVIGKNGSKLILTDHFVNMYSIRPFDTVRALVVRNQDEKYTTIVDILSVNNKELTIGWARKDFKTLKANPPKNKYNINNDGEFVDVLSTVAPIGIGARVLVVGDDEMANAQNAQEIVGAFEQAGVVVFPIILGCKKEVSGLVSRGIYIEESESPEGKCNKILTSLYRAQRFVESGKNVVVVIDDFDGVYDILMSLISDENHNYISNFALKFFNQGASYDNGGSITMFGFATNKNLRLLERLKNSATIIAPTTNGHLNILEVVNKYDKFYMDEDAITAVDDIKKVVLSKGKDKYLDCINTIKNFKRAPKEVLLSELYKL